jgi:hypothetical protein
VNRRQRLQVPTSRRLVMKDAHPAYQKVFYVACWVVLAALVVVALINLSGG